jgi:hypothetical protein
VPHGAVNGGKLVDEPDLGRPPDGATLWGPARHDLIYVYGPKLKLDCAMSRKADLGAFDSRGAYRPRGGGDIMLLHLASTESPRLQTWR